MYSISEQNLYSQREQIKRILQENEYGFIPQFSGKISVNLLSNDDKFCAGHAILSEYALTCECDGKEITFPFFYCRPSGNEKKKVVVFINFRAGVPDKYIPAEEIIDRGYAFVSFCYKDVTSDSPDFEDKAAKYLKAEGKYSAGKIAMWAWASMRVLDWLYTLDEVDKDKVGVAGHSRLGKTALLAVAFDERFKFCHSNDSGSGGAALFSLKDERSEPIEYLTRVFHYWFCPNFKNFADKEKEMDFDQHYLLSLIAPRLLSVGSAQNDLWANPKAEQKCAEKASFAWKSLGAKGLEPIQNAEIDRAYNDGKVSYYVREGNHYMSRKDWNMLLDFLDKHL